MKLATILVVLPFAAFLCGCAPAVSVNPLYSDADLNKPLNEPRIEGTWLTPDLRSHGANEEPWVKWMFGPLRWKIDPPKQQAQPNSTYSVELRCAWPNCEKEGCGTNFAARIVPIDDKLFFDATIGDHAEGHVKDTPASCADFHRGHLIGRIWVEQDFLRIAVLDSTWVKKNSPASFYDFASVGKQEDPFLITPSTQDLRNFLVQNSDNDEAMPYVYYLCRQQDECLARSFEDELRRRPADRAILEAAPDFFLKRGNYYRAAELQGRRLDLNPEDLSWHARIGDTLLLMRDFTGAHREFTVLESYSRQDSSAQEGIVWTYFLEGAYVDAVVATANYHAPKKTNSANPVLLSYFSLLRLGRSVEAKTFLRKQSAKFKGSKNERALLLQTQEHGPDASMAIVPPVDEVARRRLFFYALTAIGRGDLVSARSILEAAVAKAPNDSFFALAARIELDRLPATPKN